MQDVSKNNSGGSPGPGTCRESGGKSPPVSVEYSERRRLTSECGYVGNQPGKLYE